MKLVLGNEIRETLGATKIDYTIKRVLYWFLKLVCNRQNKTKQTPWL
jgi:hypothetical protein